MSYKSILVHVEANAASDSRIRAACDLARRFDGALIGVGAETFEQPFYAAQGPVSGQVIQDLSDHTEARLQEAAARFKRLAQPVPQGTAWFSAMDYPNRVIALHARAADLIVLSRPEEGASHRTVAAPADVIMEAGTPVLLTPSGEATLSGRHVVMGWKNTRECRRAVWDALPFLTRAERVFLVRINRGAEQVDTGLNEVAERLKRHDVTVETETITRAESTPAGDLQKAADRHGADLIVAGAYGHSRVREWVLGGVTHDLITASPKFILFSH